MSWIKRFVFHPLLLSIYPVLAFLGVNLGQVRPSIALRAGIGSVILCVLLWVLAWLIFRDLRRAAILASLLLLLFFSYGHVYESLQHLDIGGVNFGRHRYLVPLWSFLLILGGWRISRLSQLSTSTELLNILSMVLFVIPLGQLALYTFNITQPFDNPVTRDSDLISLKPSPSQSPDIYYIILDAYGGEEVLQKVYDFDNQAFISALESMGFQVASCSQSNYSQTDLSFASSLNFHYLVSIFQGTTPDRSRLWPYIRNSAVRELLEDIGYETIAFETGFSWSEIDDADHYLKPEREGFEGFNSFEMALLQSTAAWVIIDQVEGLPGFLLRDLDRSAEENYRRITYTFNMLEDLPRSDKPVFVFAHIIAPHTPFVFGADGSFDEGEISDNLDFDSYRARYIQELTYLNEMVIRTFRTILESSTENVIILLQSDHGPEKGSSSDRMSILNAYHLPGVEKDPIPDDTSPVNSFRIIFNRYFASEWEYIKDISYFSTYDEPFNFSILQNTCELE